MFDVAPIGPIAHTDWLQSLRELVPHLSRLFLSCVYSIIFLLELLLVAVIWEEAQGAIALIPPSVDGYVHTSPNFLDPKRRCG